MPEKPVISVAVQLPREVHDVVAQRASSVPDELDRLGAELERIELDDPEFGRQVRDRWSTERKAGSMINNVHGNVGQVIIANRIDGGINFHG